MDEIALFAELLFLVLFIATFVGWLRRRDQISLDLSLIFSGLGLLFVLQLWERVTGVEPPALLSQAVTLLFFVLQPLFTLHLVSLVRRVPRPVLIGSTILMLGLGVPTVLFAGSVPRELGIGAILAFVAIDVVAAGYLLGDARRRRGPGAIRMLIAALATTLLAAALLAILAGSVVVAFAGVSRSVAVVLALVAGIGYLVAFLPPLRLRRFWQAGPTLEYSRALLARPDAAVDEIWRGFAQIASSVTGAGAVVIAASEANHHAAVIGSAGVRGDLSDERFSLAELELLLEAAATGARFEKSASAAGVPAARLAARVGARFASVVPVGARRPTALVLLSPYRSLFHASDHEVLSALGAQTAIVAERRAIVAEQQAMAERLAATVEVLRSASQAKSDFLASMSHELRTPLSAILGFSELMRQEQSQGDSVLVPLEWVEHIHRGGEHLLTLINDVLDLAKVEAGRLELRPETLDLRMVVAETLNGIRPLAERKHLVLAASLPSLTLLADRGRFRQILYNLLSNAIKYTPDGGSVRVEAEEREGELRVTVVDSGVGISPEDQTLVFDEFRQVGDPGERQAGTGLGLALTRRLTEAHGGRIELESTRGVGSRFTVILPAAAGSVQPGEMPGPSAERPIDGAAVRPSAGRVDILVIEDDPSAVRLLRQYLEPAGYTVTAAPTGEVGLAMAKERPPAAIVLDVLLPGLDGWEVLRRLKAESALRDVPVIIVTVVDERGIGLALGAVDYLVKPIQREALLACLARYTLTTKVQQRRVRILAVDDEPGGLALIRAALEPDGFEVIDASGGREALELMEKDGIDLVVCDLAMPDMDGFEVIAALKANPKTADVPILVCTARDLSDADKERLNGQIVGTVVKGADARDGLRGWLARVAPLPALKVDDGSG
jgi:signal transduction histidine kinase/DNA-binding response OmpR family regulator